MDAAEQPGAIPHGGQEAWARARTWQKRSGSEAKKRGLWGRAWQERSGGGERGARAMSQGPSGSEAARQPWLPSAMLQKRCGSGAGRPRWHGRARQRRNGSEARRPGCEASWGRILSAAAEWQAGQGSLTIHGASAAAEVPAEARVASKMWQQRSGSEARQPGQRDRIGQTRAGQKEARKLGWVADIGRGDAAVGHARQGCALGRGSDRAAERPSCKARCQDRAKAQWH